MGKSRSSIEFRETTENNMPGVSIILGQFCGGYFTFTVLDTLVRGYV